MTPRNYYVAPLSAFQGLRGVEWHATHTGILALHLGHVDFSGDPPQKAAFEAIAGVVKCGTLLDTTIPAAVVTALQSFGVVPTDTVMSAAQKVLAVRGGLTLHL